MSKNFTKGGHNMTGPKFDQYPIFYDKMCRSKRYVVQDTLSQSHLIQIFLTQHPITATSCSDLTHKIVQTLKPPAKINPTNTTKPYNQTQ